MDRILCAKGIRDTRGDHRAMSVFNTNAILK